MTEQKLNQKALEHTRSVMNIDSIREQINGGTFKMNKFAADNKLQVKMVRQVLTEMFGNTIVYKRGKYGGISFVKEGE